MEFTIDYNSLQAQRAVQLADGLVASFTDNDALTMNLTTVTNELRDNPPLLAYVVLRLTQIAGAAVGWMAAVEDHEDKGDDVLRRLQAALRETCGW